MTVIVVAIALILLMIAAVLAYKKSKDETEKAAAMLQRLIEVYAKWDVENLRKEADNIISGSLKVNDVVVLGLYLGLKIKRAKEGEPDYAKDIERIEQLEPLYLKEIKEPQNKEKE